MRRVIACLWEGDESLPDYSRGKYGADDVEKLLDGIERHVSDGQLIMLVDEWGGDVLSPMWAGRDVSVVPFAYPDPGGWGRMLEAFRPTLWPKQGERNLLVGLDTVLTGDCDWLFEWDKSPVGLPLDPYNAPQVCNAVVSYDAEGAAIVWRARGRVADTKYAGVPSEMALLRKLYVEQGWSPLEDTPTKLLSYKVHVRDRRRSLHNASVVYFHGRSKPADLPEDDPVRRMWDGH